jgi:hypothetical protein
MAGATFVRTTLDRKVHETALLRRVHKNEISHSKGLEQIMLKFNACKFKLQSISERAGE